MKKRNGIKKRLLSLMLTAAMMAGGVPNPANLVLADELNNKITIEANTETEAPAETEAVAESEIQSETEAVSQEETVTEDVSETDAVEGTTKETTEESDNVSETEIHTETETHTVEETVEASTEETENGWDGVTTENIYEAENYKVTYTLSSHWNTGYNANIKIENTSDTAIENWYLSFGYDSEIINIWNAQIHEKTQNGYIIKNAGWNQDIPAGKFVEFGISGNEGFKGFPQKYEIQGSSSEVKTEDYTVAYNLQSDWVSGFVASITVTNNTDKTLEDWVLEFDFDRQISQIWDGEILSHEGNHYVVKNAGYNANIAAGATVNFGFQGGEAIQMQEPENYKLYSYNADKTGNENGNENNSDETDRSIDTDKDGVSDYIEEAFGTDKGKTDTDGDGLSDYDEILSIVLDPCNTDTDGDGIADGDEDTDSDGLTNLEEIKQETLISDDDSDHDGLKDGDEVYKYGTKPCCDDTDGDGASDGKETELGTDPLVADKTFNISMESDDEDTVKASVSIGLSGEQIDTLSVERFENDFLFPENMPGYIGAAYDFSVEGDFESAIINFEFDEELLSNPEFDPVIYYFNEEEQELEELETTVAGNVASARVEHFSKYILRDKGKLNNIFSWQDVWESDDTVRYDGIEVVFVVDFTDSMAVNDKENKRIAVVHDLIDTLPQNGKAGIVKPWESSLTWMTKVTDDREGIKSYLDSSFCSSDENPWIYWGIECAFSMFESSDDSTGKIIVVLSDGELDSTQNQESVISDAKDNNVKIYTVGLGENAELHDKYLKPLSEKTGGSFYHISNVENITEIYNDVNKNEDIEKDSDGDGIPDYYEDNLPMFNGLTLHLDKNNPDSDGDGLDDGEEVWLEYEYNEDKTQVKVTGKFWSDPDAEDTDGDGLWDIDELYVYDTYALYADSDFDGLNDGIEIENWFDPHEKDYDKDGRLDLEEYEKGTSPYIYDKSRKEHLADFAKGFIAGEGIENTDSIPCILGKITSGFTPVGNVRDMIIDVIQGDWLDAGLNFAGTFIDATDVVKTGGIIGKFLINNADDIGLYAEIVTFLNKNFPDAVKHLGKSDEFVLATKEVVKASNGKITKKQYKEMLKSFAEAGIEYLFSENSDLEAVPTYTPYTDEMRKYIIVPEDGYQAYLERQYIRIRKLGFDDISVISKNTGISEEDLYKLKKHLFLDTHMISIEGAPLREFYFQADPNIIYAWNQAIKEELLGKERVWFEQLVKHELTESSYMEQGMLFRDPSTYGDNGFEIVPSKNAHDRANLTAKQPGDYPGYKWNKEFIKYYDDKIEY